MSAEGKEVVVSLPEHCKKYLALRALVSKQPQEFQDFFHKSAQELADATQELEAEKKTLGNVKRYLQDYSNEYPDGEH